ncbi:golgin subfamily A member 6-like protein 4 [Amia ocellicauda]|uniref:golgin subfamily A member 6-like protein 4 n=1 Tax=Amia ocellicauda TaxID=2972642 RepID=UPI003463B6D8
MASIMGALEEIRKVRDALQEEQRRMSFEEKRLDVQQDANEHFTHEVKKMTTITSSFRDDLEQQREEAARLRTEVASLSENLESVEARERSRQVEEQGECAQLREELAQALKQLQALREQEETNQKELEKMYSSLRRSEARRKSLSSQKEFLLLQLRQSNSHERALRIIQMAYLTNRVSKLPEVTLRPLRRFRAAVKAVIAITRMKVLAGL